MDLGAWWGGTWRRSGSPSLDALTEKQDARADKNHKVVSVFLFSWGHHSIAITDQIIVHWLVHPPAPINMKRHPFHLLDCSVLRSCGWRHIYLGNTCSCEWPNMYFLGLIISQSTSCLQIQIYYSKMIVPVRAFVSGMVFTQHNRISSNRSNISWSKCFWPDILPERCNCSLKAVSQLVMFPKAEVVLENIRSPLWVLGVLLLRHN